MINKGFAGGSLREKESWDFWSMLCWGNGLHEQGFMYGGLYWVGIDFTTTFCAGLIDPTDGKEQNHIFIYVSKLCS